MLSIVNETQENTQFYDLTLSAFLYTVWGSDPNSLVPTDRV